jgi:hypothetical protein
MVDKGISMRPTVVLIASLLVAGCGSAQRQGPQADVRALDVSARSLESSPNDVCAITYRDKGDGTMTWTATVTEKGELITHASDNSGDINRHDDPVTPGAHAYTANAPISQIGDIGGDLYVGGSQFGCSVGPAAATVK